MSITCLIFISLPKNHANLNEPLLRTAASFLETQGSQGERIDLGTFQREGRAGPERLTLTTFAIEEDALDDERARALEGVLRQTLKATGAGAGDVRVFVSDAEATP